LVEPDWIALGAMHHCLAAEEEGKLPAAVAAQLSKTLKLQLQKRGLVGQLSAASPAAAVPAGMRPRVLYFALGLLVPLLLLPVAAAARAAGPR
jgi:hypothetical protein